MVDRRLYLEPGLWRPRVVLHDKKKRYLVDVLRLVPGAKIEVFDGRGFCCEAVLESCDGAWVLSLGNRQRSLQDGPVAWLGCAILKGRAFDEAIRMVSEIGVDTFFPFVSERVVPRLKDSRISSRMSRWTKIATEAARQSGRTKVMEIEPMMDFSDMMSIPRAGCGILLHPDGDMPLLKKLETIGSQDRFVLVGPEGGFSPNEVEQAKNQGFSVCSLGVNVLRARTAVVVAAAFSCLDTIGNLE